MRYTAAQDSPKQADAIRFEWRVHNEASVRRLRPDVNTAPEDEHLAPKAVEKSLRGLRGEVLNESESLRCDIDEDHNEKRQAGHLHVLLPHSSALLAYTS